MSDQCRPQGLVRKIGLRHQLAVRVLVMELLRRLAQVEARLNQTSRNSSKPPSSDPPRRNRERRKTPRAASRAGSPGMKATDAN